MKIVTVVGARPQFIKLALVSRQLRKRNREIIVHTGQHYDSNLSDIFFKQLRLPSPDYNLGIVSSLQGEQVAGMLKGIERVLVKEKPDLVIVFGDTNSTLAGALAAAKLDIPIAHIEAGLRSFNRNMPEEINRLVTDHLSAFLFCPTATAVNNLKREGIINGVFEVGDVMEQSLFHYLRIAKDKSRILDKLGLLPKGYFLATIHRAENTNNKVRLKELFSTFAEIKQQIVLPLHPRTRKMLRNFGIFLNNNNLLMTKPLSYFDMLMLEQNSSIILTDSGGVQREAYYLRIPCITLRNETEWVETVKSGWNVVAGADKKKVKAALDKFLNGRFILPDKPGTIKRVDAIISGILERQI